MNLPTKIQQPAQRFLLPIYNAVFAGLLGLSGLMGLFPIVVVCDDGNLIRCLGVGLIFFAVPAGIAAITFGGAILAVKNPRIFSRLFLLVDSVAIVILAVWIASNTVPFFSYAIGSFALLPLLGAIFLKND